MQHSKNINFKVAYYQLLIWWVSANWSLLKRQ